MRVEPVEGGFEGRAPDWFGPTLFGGFLLGQAVYATGLTVPEDRRIHSLHAYFLRPGKAGPPLRHTVSTVRDGRAFAVRRLETVQDGKTVFEMACSFTDAAAQDADADPLPADVPGPDTKEPESGWGPWLRVRLEPQGRMSSRSWFRFAGRLPDEPRLHDAVIALMSDMTANGGRPVPGESRHWVSLDHAAWFHRRLRADEWIYFGVGTTIRSGSRALIEGVMHSPGRDRCLTMAQEALLP